MPSSSSSSNASSSSSSSSFIDILHEVVVAMAARDYGEGRVFIHTDRIGGFGTGHGDNPKEFWRKILEWTSRKSSNDLIKIGLVINVQPSASDKINSMKPILVDKLSISKLATVDLSKYDCIYVVGLPDLVSSVVTLKLKTFVENGGGLVIEYPNRSRENINILRSIENIYCYSSERLFTSNAYWTIDGGSHYVFDNDAEISFMSTLRQNDFSEEWTILMTNISNAVTTTTTTSANEILTFDQATGSEFIISFMSSMQNGIVVIEPCSESTSSYSSLSSSSSSINSNSSSSENVNWDLCDNIIAEWRMDDNNTTSIVSDHKNNFLHTGVFQNSSGNVRTMDRHVTGKINGALSFNSSLVDRIVTQNNTDLNFTDGVSDLPFSISMWIYPTDLSVAQYIIMKDTDLSGQTGWWFYSIGSDIYFVSFSGVVANYMGRHSNSGALTANTWNHIIISYNAIPLAGLKLYVNSNRVDAVNDSGGTYVTMNDPNTSLYMSYTSSPFSGYMDQIVIFDRELSQVEIEALYNLGRGTVECRGEYWRTSSSSSSSTEIRSSSSNSSSSSSSP